MHSPDRPEPARSSPLRLPAGTAGRIVVLLRRVHHTVEELAAELGLTDNAVRAHLTRLERDGLVGRTGLRAGVSRPSVLYSLTPDAELLFSRAYVPVLTQLLHVLAGQMRPAEFDRTLRLVGEGLMAGRPRPKGTLRQRAERGSALLNELGGISRVDRDGSTLVIRGDSCPLAAATRNHPEACSAVESLLTAFVDAPVRSCCERETRARCCFAIGAGARSR
ncbi:MAG TPA: ArsR family transcriptional regulator [Gemmatimonadaceae bacterium]